MSKNGLAGFLIIAACILVVSVAQTSADVGKAAGDLTYDFYAIRGGENFMTVSAVATVAPCATPLPKGKEAFTYTPVVAPVPDCTPAKAKPIGVGSIANGGAVLDLVIDVGPFASPVDVSLGIFQAAFDATDIYFINAFNQLTSVQDELLAEIEAEAAGTSKSSNGQGNGQVGNNGNGNGQAPVADNPKPKKKFKKLTPWRSDVIGVRETIVTVPAGSLPPGLYVVILNVTRVSPADDNFDRFYRWITFFIVPD